MLGMHIIAKTFVDNNKMEHKIAHVLIRTMSES